LLLLAIAAALLVGISLTASANAQDASLTFTVNSTADDADPSPGNGVCATAAGECTLRAAIQSANKHTGPDTIAFNIPGGGVKTILPTKALPTLTDTSGPTIIDGYTQPGSSPNTDSLVSNAQIMVQLEGAGHDQFHGLTINSPANVVRGLALYRFQKVMKLDVVDAHHNHISGNFIGTNAAGTYNADIKVNYANGVHISGGATNNVIGGTSPAERNVLSGNSNHGVGLYTDGTDGNVIVGNIIGLNPSGNGRLTNKSHGVDINNGASFNIIGGTAPGERNVISGNTREGVEVSHGGSTVGEVTGNQIIGNFIGTDVTGERAPAYSSNGNWGVHLQDSVEANVAAYNVIGNNGGGGSTGEDGGGIGIGGKMSRDNQVHNNLIGISPGGAAIPNSNVGVKVDHYAKGNQIGPNNVIANNPIGVHIKHAEADFNTITRNSIYNNSGLGIDLDPVGAVNGNDLDDADTGSNEQLNFPVIESATLSTVSGTACSATVVPKPCTVEVFLADRDPSGYGEGKTFVGSSTTNADGTFAVVVSGLVSGDYVTATATDANGNTSEFSANMPVAASSDTTAMESRPSMARSSSAWNPAASAKGRWTRRMSWKWCGICMVDVPLSGRGTSPGRGQCRAGPAGRSRRAAASRRQLGDGNNVPPGRRCAARAASTPSGSCR
jgi:CSLREA domain-containing protein